RVLLAQQRPARAAQRHRVLVAVPALLADGDPAATYDVGAWVEHPARRPGNSQRQRSGAVHRRTTAETDQGASPAYRETRMPQVDLSRQGSLELHDRTLALHPGPEGARAHRLHQLDEVRR